MEALAKQEVDKFFGQSINWMSELKEYCVGDHDDVKWSRVSIGDTLYVAQHFDLLKWWEKKGQHLFKLIRLVAPRILATPGSNAFQERIFSKCTFFDSKLRAKTGDNRFEMGVLSAANRGEMKAVAPLSQDLLGTASDSVSSFFGVSDITLEGKECEDGVEEVEEVIEEVAVDGFWTEEEKDGVVEG